MTEKGSIEIETEVATGEGRDHVDLELRVVGETDRRDLRRRAWIEVKIDAAFGAEEVVEGGRLGRDPQLVRYRRALDARDDVHGHLPRSPLAVLLPGVDERRDRAQIDDVDAAILYWQRIGDLAAERGREIAGDEWRLEGRKPSAVLELANLETLVWFLEDAAVRTPSGDRREFVGISVTDPLTRPLIGEYAASYRAVRTVLTLGERVALIFEDRRWTINELVATGGDDGVLDALSVAVALISPEQANWWNSLGGVAQFVLQPIDDRDPPVLEGPVGWAGVSFNSPELAPKSSAKWLEHLASEGFVVFEEADTATLEYVGAAETLGKLVDETANASDQAATVANWIDHALDYLARLGSPAQSTT